MTEFSTEQPADLTFRADFRRKRSHRPGIILGGFAALGFLLLATFGWASLTGRIAYASPAGSVSLGLALVLLATTMVIALQQLRGAQARERTTWRETVALRERGTNLERQVRELEAGNTALEARSAELEATNLRLQRVLEKSERYAALLQTSVEVSRTVAEIRNPGELLSGVTELISEHFGYYHVGIFMIDDSGLNAVLRAANSPGGQRMLARGHRLPVGTAGIVGYATGTGRPRVARDVDHDAAHQDNPDLPETRSELALPLRLNGRVIGALDVQSVEADVFGPEDVAVLTALADQIAVAVENSRLMEQSQGALQETRASQRRAIQREWDAYLGRQPGEAMPLRAGDGQRRPIRRETGAL